MSVSIKLQERYASSIYELADETGKLDAILQDMVLFTRVCNENRDLLLMLRSPIVLREKKLKVLKSIFEGKVNELTISFLSLLIRKERDNAIYEIANYFQKLYKIKKGIVSARVITAVPLSKELNKQFIDAASSLKPGKTIELHNEVEEDVIGGFVLRLDDRQIDQTVKTQLRKLKQQLN